MRFLGRCILFCALTLLVGSPARAIGADRGLGDLKVIRMLPRTSQEIGDSHERSRSQSCEAVPADEPLEISGFMPCLTSRDRAEFDRGVLLLPSSRRHIFTIGLEMLSDDKARLPTISSSQILRYLQDHYVTIQARIQKDPITSELFLHHRPLAITATFGRGSLTQEFTDATLAAVREFHSLGLFLPSQAAKQPKNLRTIVLTYRSVEVLPAESNSKPKLQPKFEFVFIHAREVENSATKQLSLSAFATSDQRRKLHLLHPWSLPQLPQQCGVNAKVLFTEFSTLGLIPTKSATRNVTYNSKSVFSFEELNQFAQAQQWQGDAFDNLNLLLDAIVDGKLSSNR